MAVRKTESRLPDGFQPSDLGQAVTSAGGTCSLISFVTSPLVINRTNQYVVLIQDAGLAASAASYAWTVTESSGAPINSNSPTGELTYVATKIGNLQVAVNVLDGGGGTLATLTLQQDVTDPSEELEDLITESADTPGPGMANPDALRELINEHNMYYSGVALQNPETGLGFKRLVFNMAFDGVLKRNPFERKRHLNQLADAVNAGTSDLATVSTQGAGVCSVRLLLLAMTIPGMVPFTLLPQDANQRALAANTLYQSLAQLSDEKKIDLFNIVRFPRSNIIYCGRILENLRNQYFAGTTFDDVLTGMSGARAQWIIGQYRQGPVSRN